MTLLANVLNYVRPFPFSREHVQASSPEAPAGIDGQTLC